MSQPAIIVEGISKRYRLGHANTRHQTFREMAMGMIAAPFRKLRAAGEAGNEGEEFWALKDLNFEVQPGEVVGIIGRNGAGKSTLLKILSRITEPTSGQIRLRGRVASLLEVGTGFHPELTGRENIYLNGAILGMRRAEITKKFDEIVAFAETEKFLDTPVKFYSSGMYVRLAFAVAAHLEPEILIVDEVLAVGDAEFQKKCLGKMKEVSEGGGRTVLFVSHNMVAIRALCTSAVLLSKGQMSMADTVEAVVEQYMRPIGNRSEVIRTFSQPLNVPLWMTKAFLLLDGNATSTIPMGSNITLEVHFRADPPIRQPKLGFVILASDGTKICCANNRYQEIDGPDERMSEGVIRCELGAVPLMPGSYVLALYLGHTGADTHVVEEAIHFEITENDLWGQGKLPPRGAATMWWPAEFRLSSSMAHVAHV
jgi:lipopolysaccharide transport system ATP-binding protein